MENKILMQSHTFAKSEADLGEIPAPGIGSELVIDDAVHGAMPIPGTIIKNAHHYGSSLWGITSKLTAQLPDGTMQNYFLKIIPFETPGRQMCEGEFESLVAMRKVVPSFIPKVYKWGPLTRGPGYFLVAEFRDVGQQPPEPKKFTQRLAELHRQSVSPDGKFGFHVPTFHGNLATHTQWENSWTTLYSKILTRALEIDAEKHGAWPELEAVGRLLINKVVPRLLDALTSNGRSIKPCLVHGDLWDENCATDINSGEPFAFDAGSLYAHNEYEIGYWRPARHRLSNKAYVRAYKRCFPVSEPAEEWDSRNLLYSMRYNIGYSVLIPTSGQRTYVFDDMKTLCRKFFPQELREIEGAFTSSIPESLTDMEELEFEDDGDYGVHRDSTNVPEAAILKSPEPAVMIMTNNENRNDQERKDEHPETPSKSFGQTSRDIGADQLGEGPVYDGRSKTQEDSVIGQSTEDRTEITNEISNHEPQQPEQRTTNKQNDVAETIDHEAAGKTTAMESVTPKENSVQVQENRPAELATTAVCATSEENDTTEVRERVLEEMMAGTIVDSSPETKEAIQSPKNDPGKVRATSTTDSPSA